MHKFFQLNLGLVLPVTFLIAICFVKFVSLWIILLLTQLLLIRVLAASVCRILVVISETCRKNCMQNNLGRTMALAL